MIPHTRARELRRWRIFAFPWLNPKGMVMWTRPITPQPGTAQDTEPRLYGWVHNRVIPNGETPDDTYSPSLCHSDVWAYQEEYMYMCQLRDPQEDIRQGLEPSFTAERASREPFYFLIFLMFGMLPVQPHSTAARSSPITFAH